MHRLPEVGALRCSECGREADEFATIAERWTWWPDGCGELPEDVFTTALDGLWSVVLRRKGGPFSVLGLMPPDPSLT